jgi:hypothetical protein
MIEIRESKERDYTLKQVIVYCCSGVQQENAFN